MSIIVPTRLRIINPETCRPDDALLVDTKLGLLVYRYQSNMREILLTPPQAANIQHLNQQGITPPPPPTVPNNCT